MGQIAVAFLIFVQWVEQTCLEWLMATHLHSQEEEKRCENKKKGDQCDDRGVYYSFMGPLYAVCTQKIAMVRPLLCHTTLHGNIQSTSQKDIYTCVVRPGQLLDWNEANLSTTSPFCQKGRHIGPISPQQTGKWEGREKKPTGGVTCRVVQKRQPFTEKSWKN